MCITCDLAKMQKMEERCGEVGEQVSVILDELTESGEWRVPARKNEKYYNRAEKIILLKAEQIIWVMVFYIII